MKWDIFISYASEDKEDVVKPLAHRLMKEGLAVWYDENELKMGDNLREKIDEGLKNSRYGVVILSPDFFRKKWPQYELDSLVSLQEKGEKKILPIWHNVDVNQVKEYSPSLSNIKAANTKEGIINLVEEILAVCHGLQEEKTYVELAKSIPVIPIENPIHEKKSEIEKETISDEEIKRQKNEEIEQWVASCRNRLRELYIESALKDEDSPFSKGYWIVAYSFLEEIRDLDVKRFLDVLGNLEMHQSGWPPWWISTRRAIAPYPYDDLLECWIYEGENDPAHSDFWRASPSGKLFLKRGFYEDNLEEKEPGTFFDIIFPIRQVTEAFLHSLALSKSISSYDNNIVFELKWHGLNNRILGALDPRIHLSIDRISKQNDFEIIITTSPQEIELELEKLVYQVIYPLFRIFEFFELSEGIIRDFINRMRKWPLVKQLVF